MENLAPTPLIPKLYMILLGSKAPGRHVEQHDFFFAIGTGLKEFIPMFKAFWPEAKDKIHIDGYREVTNVDGYQVNIVPAGSVGVSETDKKLFFINLGGYQENKFEEQHYAILTVKNDKAAAFREAKNTLFYKHNHFGTATSHIDDKYGVDVDHLYQIEDILTSAQKAQYQITLTPAENLKEDYINLGYFKLSNL